MRRFMKITTPSEGYEEVKKLGDKYLIHLDRNDVSETEVECFECLVDENEYNIETIKSELVEYKQYINAVGLNIEKKIKIDAINEYDKSSSVNSFTYNGVEMWLDKTTRNGLSLRFNAEKLAGKTETTLWFGTQSFTLNIDNGIQLLYALEVYASECFDNTASHIAAVEAMTNIDDVKNYDHTQGYPAKLIINS